VPASAEGAQGVQRGAPSVVRGGVGLGSKGGEQWVVAPPWPRSVSGAGGCLRRAGVMGWDGVQT
jgi:hypothetical protein